MTTTDPTLLVDSPFAKLQPYITAKQGALGIPLTSNGLNTTNQDYLRQAANILELTGNAEFVAARIRHLDYILRNSRFAAAAKWRSTLASTWLVEPLVATPVGFTATSSNPLVALSGIIAQTQTDYARLVWTYDLTGTTNDFTLSNASGYNASFTVIQGNTGSVPLEDSGYLLQVLNGMPGGSNMTGTIKIVLPYSGNCVPIRDAILANGDFIQQLTYNKPLYAAAMNKDTPVEDTIAAFLLALDAS